MPPNPFRPIDFLDLAEELIERGSEAAFRASVSRAYYAIFLHIRERLTTSGRFTHARGGNDHRELPNALRDLGAPELCREMVDCHVARNRADYDLLPNVSVQKAREQCVRVRGCKPFSPLLK